ncbi:hypothetical protein [Massilia genomosp. 1]|uniref:Uncharacterized protein n=1 Tax=Massilia genomosp. 1 TaxID=2609280 RepID=A0ABX0N1P4_9BURK|nr:hypothetical protein [Massilia genomosp. 1]NHZ66925.1 hypothetical protein [Massilia genomosp. 1]
MSARNSLPAQPDAIARTSDDKPAAEKAGGLWADAIEAAAQLVIKQTQIPGDLLGPARPEMKEAARRGRVIAAAIRALQRPAAGGTADKRIE